MRSNAHRNHRGVKARGPTFRLPNPLRMEAQLGQGKLSATIRANLSIRPNGSLRITITEHPAQLSRIRAQQLFIRALDPTERKSRLITTEPPDWYPRVRRAIAHQQITLPGAQSRPPPYARVQRPLNELIPLLRVNTDIGVVADVFVEEDDTLVFEVVERQGWMSRAHVRRLLAELFDPHKPPSPLIHMRGRWYERLRKLIALGRIHLEEE